MNINYLEEAENYLKHYADLLKAASYTNKPLADLSRTGKTRKEETAGQLGKGREPLDNSNDEIAHIEDLLSVLGCRERKALVLYYVKNLSVLAIMKEMQIRTKQEFHKLKEKALKDFSIAMFGICALRND